MKRGSQSTKLLLSALVGVLVGFTLQRLIVSLVGKQERSLGILALVDGRPITVDAFEHEMVRRGGDRVAFADLERRKTLLDEMVLVEILAAQARKAGYADGPEFSREVRYLLAGRYRQRHINPEVAAIVVTDEEVRAHYEENRDRFAIPEARRAALIYFEYASTASEEHKREVVELAEGVRAEAASQVGVADFGVLAVRHSADQASRYQGGNIGWHVKGQEDSRFVESVMEAIFALREPGELSPPIETPKGLYLVRLLETKPASVRLLGKVAPGIRHQLLAEKREQRLQELYAAARDNVPVEINDKRLAAMDIPTPASHAPPKRPPALPQ